MMYIYLLCTVQASKQASIIESYKYIDWDEDLPEDTLLFRYTNSYILRIFLY